jgi:diguanylate cyclase (GGDEF)-like protein/PAS domain S-box-containing protein
LGVGKSTAFPNFDQRLYRTIFDMAGDAIIACSEQGVALECNQAAVELFDCTREQLLGTTPLDWSPDVQPNGRQSAEMVAEIFTRVKAQGEAHFEWENRRSDGSSLPVDVVIRLAQIEGQLLFIVNSRDIVERKRIENALQKSEHLLKESQSVAGLGSYVFDVPTGRWENSDFFDKLFGIDQTYERSVDGWAALIHPDDRKVMIAYFTNVVLALGQSFDKEYRIVRHDDKAVRWVHGLGKLEFDDLGHPVKMYGTIQDVTHRKAADEQIKELAFYDPLTRLPNRRLLMERLNQALAATILNQREGALIFADLDNFKTVNDTHGHDIGDQLLRQVAERLATSFREADTVARIGGDEFVMVLDDLSENPEEAATQAESVGKKVLAALGEPYHISGREFRSTPSIGITLFADQREGVDELMRQADIAMYQAKAAGRNTVRFFDPDLQASVKARTLMEDDLRHGITNNQFLLHYQPQVDSGEVVGAEALIRWIHPRRGMVSPSEFIPLAEETGLILPLGKWVLETACKQIADWGKRGETAGITVAVNVSARQFRQPDFVEEILEALERGKADPRRLKLELTESMLVDNIEDVVAKMTKLKSLGLSFSLDDFGTGYSSLSYLKRLPLDQLKIDQSFVLDLLADSNNGAIAQTIIALGQTMGLSVIAEGVETEEQRDFLVELGCPAYQGYLFSRPLPVQEFEKLLGLLVS